MKKLLNILIVSIISLSIVNIAGIDNVYAQEGVKKTEQTGDGRDANNLPGVGPNKLSDEQLNNAIKKATDRETAAQKNLDAIKLADKKKSTPETREALKKAEAELKGSKTDVRYQKVLNQKVKLIESSELKGANLDKEIEECKKNKCEDLKLLQYREKANFEYTAYLTELRDLELCKIHPKCKDNKKEIKRLEASVAVAVAAVKVEVAKITQYEIEREKARTFDVSDIFSNEYTPGEDNQSQKGFQDVVNTIANWMITLVASLAVTTLIIGGFLMIISGGDETRLETGKTIFTYSLIGIIVTLMAFGIISFIQSIFYA